jgi:hypothetical protein
MAKEARGKLKETATSLRQGKKDKTYKRGVNMSINS